MKPVSHNLEAEYDDSSLEVGSVAPLSSYEQVSSRQYSPFRFNRKAFVITGAALAIITTIGIGSLLLGSSHADNKAGSPASKANGYAVGSISLPSVNASPGLQLSDAGHLDVNGQLQVRDTLILTPSAAPQAPTAGQIYYDKTTNAPYYYNGSQFVSLAPTPLPQYVSSIGGASGSISVGNGLQVTGNQLALSSSVTQALNTIASSKGVTSVQGQTGNVSLTGSNGIAVNGTTISNRGVISLAAGSANVAISQDGNGNYTLSDNSVVGSGSTGQIALFTGGSTLSGSILSQSGGSITVTGGLIVSGAISTNTIQHTATGQNINISAGSDNLIFTAAGQNFTFPSGGPVSQTICTSVGNCVSGGGQSVLLQPGSAQLDAGNGSSVFVNNTGGGNLLQLQGAGSDRFVVTNGGNVTASGTVTFSGLGTGVVHTNGSGLLSSGAVLLGTDTSGSYVNSLGALTGLITSGNSGSGSTPTLSVSYGSGANTAVQGNTTLTCASGSGNLSGGGNVITLGTGGSCSSINITSSPIFSGNLSVQGANGVTIGIAGATAGKVNLANGTNTNLGTLQSAVLGQATTYTLPDPGQAAATICLSTGNCLGGGAGGANTSLSNLASVSINTNLLSGSATVDLGSGSNPFRDLYLGGSTSNNFRFTGTATVPRTITIPDANGSICLSSGNCAGVGGTGDIVGNGTSGTIPIYNGTKSIANSIITQSGTTITVGGTIDVSTALSTGGTTRIDNTGLLQNVTNANASNFFTGGALTLARGGTGLSTTPTNGQLLIGNGAGYSLGTLASGDGTIVITNGAGTINLSAPGSGTCATCVSLQAATPGVTQTGNINVSGTIIGGSFSGSGAGLTNLNGGNISSGTVNDARLSANVALLNGVQTFTGTDIFNNTLTAGGGLTIGTTSVAGILALSDGSNNTTTLQSASIGSNLTFTLPASTGAANQCIKSDGTGILSFGNCLSGAGGGGGVTDLNAFSGSVTVQGTANQVNVANASNVITLSLPQSIATTSTPTYGGLTLSSALTVANGGTGAATLTTNGVLFGNGTSAIGATAAGTTGQCLVSNGGVSGPSFQSCAGGGSGVTLQSAYNNSTSPEIILNATNGALTVRDNATTLGAGTNLLEIQNNAGTVTYLGVTPTGTSIGGTLTTTSTINSATISGGTLSGGNVSGGTLTAAAVNGLNVSGSAIDTPAASALSIGSSNATLTVGNTGKLLTLQGNASSVITATGGGFTTTVGFNGVPTASQSYFFDRTAAAGSYTICTTAGNCVGSGGGVTTPGGTTNRLSKFTGTQTIGDSNISDNGTTVSILSDAVVQGASGLSVGTTSVAGILALSDGSNNTTTLQSASIGSNLTFTLPASTGAANQCIKSDGTGILSFGNCLSGAGGGGGVTDLNAFSGSVTVQGTANQVNVANASNVITLSLPQSIATTSTPTYGGLTLSSALTVANGGTGAATLTTNGVLFGNGTSAIGATAAGTTGQCLVSNGGVSGPSFQSCAGGGSGVTLQSAYNNSTSPEIILNATNGALTVRDNATTLGAGTNLLEIQNNAGTVTYLGVTPTGTSIGGTLTTTSTINSATISGGTLSGGNVSGGTLTAAAVNGLNVSGSAIDTPAASALSIGSSNATLTVGNTGKLLTLQGNASSVITATGGGFTTTVGFNGVPTASQSYFFDRTAAAGSYTICTTAGNCVGSGGGVTTPGGTTNRLSKFTGTQTIGDSNISDNGTTVSILSDAVVQGASGLSVGTTSVAGILALSDGSNNTTTLQSASIGSNLTFTLPASTGAANQCIKSDGTGILSFGNCLSGAGGGGGVTDLNAFSGSVTVQGTANQVNVANASNVITLSLPQSIATTSTPTYGGLTLSSALTVANGGTGAATLTTNGVLFGNGTSAIGATAAGTTGQCLLATTGSAPAFGTCTGAGGVASLNGLTGALSLANASGAGSTVTINDATTVAKGIASFSSSYFTTSSGAVSLANTAVTGGTYGSATQVGQFTVDAQGRLTAASNVAITGLNSCSSCLAKNTNDTSSASFLGTLLGLTNSNTGAAGVLGLTNAGTNSALSITQSANPTAGQALILANNTNGAPSGNLIDLQVSGVSKFSVSSGGAVTATSFSGNGSALTNLNGTNITSGTVVVANGGTGAATLTTNGVLFGNGTSAIGATAAGTTGQCLLGNTAAAPSFGVCTGSGGVASLNGLTGALSLANASGAGSTVTINDAKADASTKGIATFSATNFTDNGSGTINTVQNIATSSAPTFSALTLQANTTGLSITGTPVNTANVSLIQIGSAIVGGNNVANGGTYIGLNAPGSGAGSAADLVNLQVGGSSIFSVGNTGKVVAGNSVSGAGFISRGAGILQLQNSDNSTNVQITNVGASNSPGPATAVLRILSANGVGINTAGTTLVGNGLNLGLVSSSGPTSQASIVLGTDTNLYRSAISTLKTDSALLAGSTVTATGLLTGSSGLALGTASSITGQITFKGSGGAGSLTFSGPTTPNAGNYTLSIPAISANANICTDNAVCGGYAPSTGGNYIAKNTNDTSSASFLGTLLGLTNSNTGAAGVLGLTNAGTNSALSITQSANPTAGQALILANNTNGAPSGNLIDLQVSGVSKFSVSSGGNLTVAGPTILSNLNAVGIVHTNASGSLSTSAIVNADLQGGSFTNITGVGTLTGGLNISAAQTYRIGGVDINTAGTLSNIAYLNGSGPQIFTGNNMFTGSGNNTTVVGTLFQNTSNSTTAFQIQNAAGTSNLLVADTQNNRIGIDIAVPTVPLEVNGTARATLQDKGGQVYNVKAYGAVGDGVTDDTAAINSAISAVPSPSGGVVYLPSGSYKITSGLTWNSKPIIFRGAGRGVQPGTGTRLITAAGVTAITIQDGPSGYGANSGVQDIHIVGSDSASGSNDGIILQSNGARITNVTVDYFGGTGVHILSSLGSANTAINVNNWYMDNVRSANNFTNGFTVEGVDSNAGTGIALDASANSGWGYYDNSGLGNTYIGPHAAGNLAGGYRIGNVSRNNRFIGAYAEVDATTGLQLDAGGGENNIFDGSTFVNTIVDNTVGKKNFITSENGGLHYSKLIVGDGGGNNITLSPASILIARGSFIQMQNTNGTTNWFTTANADNSLTLNSAQGAPFNISNPVNIAGTSQPGAVAGNGTSATNVLQAVGAKGGNTTGTTGQLGGVGSNVVLSAGAGGDAPSGSTGGAGGALTFTSGAGGTAPAGGTNGNGGDVTLQGGTPGAGAGTAGSYGDVLLAPNGGKVGIANNNPGNLLSIGALTTAANTYQVAVSTQGTTNSGIVIQTVAGQSSGNILQAQTSSGAILATLDYLGNLTVKAITINGHVITGNTSGSTTAAAGASAGTGATCTVSGNDTGGQVTLTTGSGSWAAGVQCTLTFSSSYASAPHPVMSKANATSTSTVQPYIGSTTSTMTFNFTSADIAANTYKFNYFNAQ